MWQRLLACAHANSRTAKKERPARSAVAPHGVNIEAPITEQIIGAESTRLAAGNGTPDAATPDRNAARGLLPSACPNPRPKIEYADAHGSDQGMRGVYLEHCPVGEVMNNEGACTLNSWEHLCVVELAEA
jgi:hypothetical protein